MPASSPGRKPAPGHVARRRLYLIHRWIGIAACLLFAMWFVSGLVMIYVPYPSLSPTETLAGAQPIDPAAVDVPPPIAGGHLPKRLWLEMRDGVPVWRSETWAGSHGVVAAAHGRALAPVDARFAARVAARFGGRAVIGVTPVERDQWTVSGGYDRHRPLWKADLADDAGTALYVSGSTGEVVQRTMRRQRFWNWLGSVPHWLYPTALRQNGMLWRQVVMWVAGPCIAAALTGIWIGILRTRPGRRRFKGGRMTPYRGWMLWHHVAGMAGGLFLLAWIFSGWLSVDPFHLFRAGDLPGPAVRAYSSGGIFPQVPLATLRAAAGQAVRIELTDHAGQPLLIAQRRAGGRRIARLAGPPAAVPDQTRIMAAAKRLVPGGRIASAGMLTAPDTYWHEPGERAALPILRLRFDDPARTWLHVDPVTGELLGTLDTRRRVYRWLFDLLHKWDLPLLTLHRPAWDILLWVLSLPGLITSVSGIRIGWKRLRGPARPARRGNRLAAFHETKGSRTTAVMPAPPPYP